MKKTLSSKQKANAYFFSKMVFNIILIIIGGILISLFLKQMQKQVSLRQQQESANQALDEVVATLEDNEQSASELTQIFHDGNQDTVEDLAELSADGLFTEIFSKTDEECVELFSDIMTRAGVEYLFLLDGSGEILLAPDLVYITTPDDPVTLVGEGLMSKENLAKLYEGTREPHGSVDPVRETNDNGDFYFYSQKIIYDGIAYYLVMGTDVSMLDMQISALKDISLILSRASVASGGFMFAVDSETGCFTYYENGDDILTGQSAAEAGLSDAAYEDGHAGVEKINDVSYYSVSRTYQGKTLICAVAETEAIGTSNGYVLFWSILGYTMVMILCLAYAVIVRNSFVREATQTKRKSLGKFGDTTLSFDVSILGKVFPLVILGVVAIFCVSLYTQTLLEISNAVDESQLAVEEASARYEESSESRESIQQYYTGHYESKAELLAYLLEEDPSVLNEPTEHYYTAYSEDGTRYYVQDNDGAYVRAVSSSEKLIELCESNDIENIYIYDESGRNIASSCEAWNYTLSYNEEDQSYPFREVLDGRKDVYIQDSSVNDEGDTSQYIGVAFYYYTSLDENNELVYHSVYEYEQYLQSQQDASGDPGTVITRHRSMLQIQLSQDIAAKMTASTDLSYVFSSGSLGNGFIALFDNDETHTLLYSPDEADIGKTAEELGVSEKAFGGEYYGFQNIDGEKYFTYVVYRDGYYLATAVPKNTMYTARMPIALVTAGVSLVLILILSMTVMFTTEEEEELYRAMSDGDSEAGNLNAAVFRIILPSGRTNTTVRASARWDNKRIPWKEKANEQKLIELLQIECGIVFVLLLITMFLADSALTSSRSVIWYILSGNWDRGLNIFACSASAALLIVTALLILLFRFPVQMLTSLLGTRSETVGHLLVSVIKYGGTLAGLFYCLYLLGLDASSLLASAGILSLVVGLGAQSLIKDIIAGVFIVFEGEFRVGDIVTIDDFRGQVMDIGLRTTKILNEAGNTKIYNNSEIAGVLNMTKAASLALCYVDIDYGQDMDYVEAVIRRELKNIQAADSRILECPEYRGVSSLGASGVQLMITAPCREGDLNTVKRVINRELIRICYQNDIHIAYNVMAVTELSKNIVHADPNAVNFDTNPAEK